VWWDWVFGYFLEAVCGFCECELLLGLFLLWCCVFCGVFGGFRKILIS